MKKIITNILILTSIMLSSCKNDKLTKEMAENIIKNDYSEYCTGSDGNDYFTKIRTDMYSPNSKELKKRMKIFRELEKQGLISIIAKEKQLPNYSYWEYKIEMTDENKKKYLHDDKVALSIAVLEEIIGISQDGNNASVKCKMKYKKTPFSILRTCMYGRCICDKENSFEKEYKLTKYDTGWKISN